MKRWRAAAALAAAAVPVAAIPAGALAAPVFSESSGSVVVEGRGFLRPPAFPGQRRHGVSVAVEPELYLEWDDGSALTVRPFLRADGADPERSHGDLREFHLRIVRDDWELGLGVGKLFWGVAESFHLVDIVNQTDLVENIDLEDKLGQPMAHLTLVRDWGDIDLVWMPLVRERTYPGRRGRLRSAIAVDAGAARHESAAGRRRQSVALRYSHSFGGWDLGVYRFHGVAREPSLAPRIDASGGVALVPTYEVIDQTGLDLQYTAGGWLWKLEALHRRGQRDARGAERDYAAFVGGFEYTFFGALDGADVGVLVERLHDGRGGAAPNPFQNDLFAGARLAFNDAADTALLAGAIRDLSSGAALFTLEASRRIGAGVRLAAEARLFADVPPDGALRDLRGDDFIQLSAGWFF